MKSTKKNVWTQIGCGAPTPHKRLKYPSNDLTKCPMQREPRSQRVMINQRFPLITAKHHQPSELVKQNLAQTSPHQRQNVAPKWKPPKDWSTAGSPFQERKAGRKETCTTWYYLQIAPRRELPKQKPQSERLLISLCVFLLAMTLEIWCENATSEFHYILFPSSLCDFFARLLRSQCLSGFRRCHTGTIQLVKTNTCKHKNSGHQWTTKPTVSALGLALSRGVTLRGRF